MEHLVQVLCVLLLLMPAEQAQAVVSPLTVLLQRLLLLLQYLVHGVLTLRELSFMLTLVTFREHTHLAGPIPVLLYVRMFLAEVTLPA